MPASAEVERTLDVLDAALYDLKIYKIKRNLAIISVISSVMFDVASIAVGLLSASTNLFDHHDLGPGIVGLVFLGIVITIASIIWLNVVTEANDRGRLTRGARKAQRLYEAAVERDKEAQAKATAAELERALKQFEEDSIRRTIRMGEVAFGKTEKE